MTLGTFQKGVVVVASAGFSMLHPISNMGEIFWHYISTSSS